MRHLRQTCDDPEGQIDYRLHDFGARGVSSLQSAELGGVAHLVSFRGTDTVPALMAAREFYDEPMAGHSIPAAEHSTITSWGREHEVDAYRNMLRQFARPGSVVAVVSDSYDLWNAIDSMWGAELRQHVIDSGATVVIRPDSGDVRTVPVEVVRRLAEKFGTTTNNKGYRVLSHVRVIQGDGVDDEHVVASILNNLTEAGFSTECLAFGMGGGLLQKLDRDTHKFAMKASAVCVGGVWRDVSKDPVTDPGKRSKTGRLALVRDGGLYQTLPAHGNMWRDEMREVYRDGVLKNQTSLGAIRARSVRDADILERESAQ